MTISNQSSRPSNLFCQKCGEQFKFPGLPASVWDRLCYGCSQKSSATNSCADLATSLNPQGKQENGQKQGNLEGTLKMQQGTGKGAPGLKDDGGKLMWGLLPWKAVHGMIKVLTFGAAKYSPNGWRTVPNAKERYQAALLRHLFALNAGETLDVDSGLRHIDHIVTNACFLSELED